MQRVADAEGSAGAHPAGWGASNATLCMLCNNGSRPRGVGAGGLYQARRAEEERNKEERQQAAEERAKRASEAASNPLRAPRAPDGMSEAQAAMYRKDVAAGHVRNTLSLNTATSPCRPPKQPAALTDATLKAKRRAQFLPAAPA